MGIGPRLAFEREKRTEDLPDSTSTLHSEVWRSSQFYGVGFGLGVEAFLARSLSAHARYGAQFGYQHATSAGDQTAPSDPAHRQHIEVRQNFWTLSDANVVFGISVYL